MAFTDLDEALAELSYGVGIDARDLDGLSLRSRKKVRKKKPTGRPRGRPPETDPDKLRARADRIRERRTATRKKARHEMKAKRIAERTNEESTFMRALENASLLEQARMICLGRGVTDSSGRPAVERLFRGTDHHEREARIDFWVWLVNVARWETRRVEVLFGKPWSELARAISKRRP
jgi:hypothetical protein